MPRSLIRVDASHAVRPRCRDWWLPNILLCTCWILLMVHFLKPHKLFRLFPVVRTHMYTRMCIWRWYAKRYYVSIFLKRLTSLRHIPLFDCRFISKYIFKHSWNNCHSLVHIITIWHWDKRACWILEVSFTELALLYHIGNCGRAQYMLCSLSRKYDIDSVSYWL